MSIERVYLGRCKLAALKNEPIYLSKHSWACSWYWGLGYIGNKNLHAHFDSYFLGGETSVDEVFETPQYSQDSWWVIRDLFIQAYALKKCAEVYRCGGHQTSKKGTTDIIKDDEMYKRLNADLEKVLNTLWAYLLENKNA